MWIVGVVLVVMGWAVVFLHQMQKAHVGFLRKEKGEVLRRMLERKVALHRAQLQGHLLRAADLEKDLEEDQLWLWYFDQQLGSAWWL